MLTLHAPPLPPPRDALPPPYPFHAERRGEGAPVLLIHGLGSEGGVWAPVVDWLVHLGREAVVADLPGHGQTPPLPPDDDWSMAAQADRLTAWIHATFPEPPDVVGFSLGGWLALEVAKRGGARSVLAVNPAGLWRRASRITLGLFALGARLGRHPRLVRALCATAVGRVLLNGAAVGRPGRLRPEEAARLLIALAESPGFPPLRDAHLLDRFSGGDAISVPVTVAWGTRDRFIPPWARRRGSLPPQTRFVTLPRCGHVPSFDDAARLAGLITDRVDLLRP